MAKVSIIIPVYNVEKYLNQCLDSAVNQTLDDIEIICINDGSTDSSLKILEEYKNRYEKFHVITQDNRGLGATRNIGIKIASGKYLYFLDSDDYIELDAMEICYNECEKHSLDFVTFDCNTFYEDNYNGNYTHKIDRSDILTSEVSKGNLLLNKLIESNRMYYETWINFFNGDFLIDNNINYRENLIYEDVLSTVKCYLFSEKVKYINNKLFNRRVRNNSIMTKNKTDKNIEAHFICAKELYELYNLLINDMDMRTKRSLEKCICNFYSYCLINSYNLNTYDWIKTISKSIKSKTKITNIELDILVDTPRLLIKK